MTPDEHTIQETFLEVGDGHTLYIHDWGNPKARTPIIFLHGGPGSGCNDGHKQLFDPTSQRVIFFDQRGAGRSLPFGFLEHNTTQDLVEDVERVANHAKLKQFIIMGGSWGSCLALAYALKYPAHISAMVLRGIFTCSKAEVDWMDKGEWRTFFPEVWEQYVARTPHEHRDNPTAYHSKQALGKDRQAAKLSAYAYSCMGGSLLKLDDRFKPRPIDEFDPAETCIEMFYFANHCFMPDRYILDNAHQLKIPTWIVQGRYDFICPPTTAYELHKNLPNSQLVMTIAGHHGADRNTYDVTRTILLRLTSERNRASN